MKTLLLGVLVSGRGSNLQAILEAIYFKKIPAQVVVVLTDQPGAPALEHLAGRNIPGLVLPRADFPSRAAFEKALADNLEAHKVDLVVLAGFMRVVGPDFIKRFTDKIINIHPSLLPSFPGLEAQKQALDYGVKISGCTIHYVNEIVDGGQIIDQAAVPVLPNDTEAILSARILAEEHRLLPAVISRLAQSWKDQ